MMTPALRIGAVARRTGVAVATLRAWESRYGVLKPARTEGGHRLYAEDDVERVLAVLRLTSQGWSVAAAAASITADRSPSRLGLVATGPDAAATADSGDGGSAARDAAAAGPARGGRGPDPATARFRDALGRAIHSFDGAAAETVLDESFARFGVAFTLEDVVMPVLRELGEGWEHDPALIASEHFATNTLRPRLQRLLHVARSAAAPVCLAAAPAEEDHELGVLAAAAVAADQGFRVTYLGSRTPVAALERSAATLRPDVVLIGAINAKAARRFLDELPDLSGACLIVGGPGFTDSTDRLPEGARHAGSITELGATLRSALQRGGATG
jgi:MerR family transcriptional regulator, light-induced transcriptional regulator